MIVNVTINVDGFKPETVVLDLKPGGSLKRGSYVVTKKHRDARNKRIRKSYLAGNSMATIALEEGITAEYVRQLVHKMGIWKASR